MKWLLTTQEVGGKAFAVFQAVNVPCRCGDESSLETLRLVGRFNRLSIESGARLETGPSGFLRVFAANCFVPSPNPQGVIAFVGVA